MTVVIPADRYGRPKSNGAGLTANERIEQLERIIVNRGLMGNSLVTRRAENLGIQFGGNRDIYEAVGYKKGDIAYTDYLGRFLRQDIANRVIKAAPASTWRRSPVLFDGTGEERRNDTEFVQAWRDLTNIEDVSEELVDAKTVWHYLRRVDILAGLGKYAALLVGIKDGKNLNEPLERGTAPQGEDGFLYLMPYGEDDVTIKEKETDRQNRRFGLPIVYGIRNVGDVHWTRVVHVAEDLLTDEIEGRPRAEAVYNRLEDLDKVIPAAAESAWKMMWKGAIVKPDEGYTLGGNSLDTDDIKAWVHGQLRVIEAEGFDIRFEGGEVVDPSGLVDLLIMLISVATGIPKRILMGSERGELASSQDEANWAARIAERQGTYAEPIVLRPFVNRLIFASVLPAPIAGAYSLEWPSLFELNELEQANVRDRKALAVQRLEQALFQSGGIVVDPEEARTEILGLPAREVSANRRDPFRVQQEVDREEATPGADVADRFANELSEELRRIYDEWLADLSRELEDIENRGERNEVIAAALALLLGRVRAQSRLMLLQLALELSADDVQLAAMERQLDESLRIFRENTLTNIRRDVNVGLLDPETTPEEQAAGRVRDVALAGGILWSAFQASKFAGREAENPLVRWEGPVDGSTCGPCSFQMGRGCRPLSQTPMPGPDVCAGLTNCRHDLIECRR